MKIFCEEKWINALKCAHLRWCINHGILCLICFCRSYKANERIRNSSQEVPINDDQGRSVKGTRREIHRIFRYWKGNLHKLWLKQISGSEVVGHNLFRWDSGQDNIFELGKGPVSACVDTQNRILFEERTGFKLYEWTGHRDKVMMSLARSFEAWKLLAFILGSGWRELDLLAASMTTHDVAPGCRANLPRP